MNKGRVVVQVSRVLIDTTFVTGNRIRHTVITKGLPADAELCSVTWKDPETLLFTFSTGTVSPLNPDNELVEIVVTQTDSFELMNNMVRAMLHNCGLCQHNNTPGGKDCWKLQDNHCDIATVLRKYDEAIGVSL